MCHIFTTSSPGKWPSRQADSRPESSSAAHHWMDYILLFEIRVTAENSPIKLRKIRARHTSQEKLEDLGCNRSLVSILVACISNLPSCIKQGVALKIKPSQCNQRGQTGCVFLLCSLSLLQEWKALEASKPLPSTKHQWGRNWRDQPLRGSESESSVKVRDMEASMHNSKGLQNAKLGIHIHQRRWKAISHTYTVGIFNVDCFLGLCYSSCYSHSEGDPNIILFCVQTLL